MKKLVVIVGFAVSSILTSCSLFISTPHAKAGGSVGSTQPIHQDHAKKAVKI